MELNWINSFGGPLILLDRSYLDYWKGSDEINGTRDYERACRIEDYLGLVKVGDFFGLILGDEPNQTAWKQIDLHQGILIRWVWADNEAEIENSIEDIISKNEWQETNLEIEFQTGNLFLFDSAFNSKKNEHLVNSLNIELNAGIYSLKTLFYKPNERLNLVIHKIVRVS